MRRGRRGSKTRQQIHINGEEAEPEKDNLIFNLTGNTLHPDEVSLLNKGLSFVPSKPADSFVTKIELFKFFRNLRLKSYYRTLQLPLLRFTTNRSKVNLNLQVLFALPSLTPHWILSVDLLNVMLSSFLAILILTMA